MKLTFLTGFSKASSYFSKLSKVFIIIFLSAFDLGGLGWKVLYIKESFYLFDLGAKFIF